MAVISGVTSLRDDFRCGLCRQKNAFHCEHDTPYRDQLLGTYEKEKLATTPTNSQGSHRSHPSNKKKNNPSNSRVDKSISPNQNQQGNMQEKNLSTNPNMRNQQVRGQAYNSSTNTAHSTGTSTQNEQKKKNKSCVIL